MRVCMCGYVYTFICAYVIMHVCQVAEYQEFWGAKCQLRRFKDGSIVEAVVWEAEESASGGAGKGKGRKLNSIGATGAEVVERILRWV